MTMVQVESIWKSYDASPVLKDVSFSISKGEIVGLLGPNGAGKTTLLKVLSSYHMADSGTVLLNGKSDIKSHCGYLSENAPLYENMTVKEYLLFLLSAKGVQKADRENEFNRLVELFSLEDQKNLVISVLSSGFRQRCAIAGAMTGNISLLILDEPAKGLDPLQIVELRNIIRSYAGEISVLISSHILAEIEILCDRVLILDEGKLQYDSPICRLDSDKSVIYNVLVSGDKKKIADLKKIGSFSILSDHNRENDMIELKIQITADEYKRRKGALISNALAAKSICLHSLDLERNSLEDIFMNITGRKND